MWWTWQQRVFYCDALARPSRASTPAALSGRRIWKCQCWCWLSLWYDHGEVHDETLFESFYFCWASSLLSPSTAFQASHLAPPLVFKMIKTLIRSPKVYKRFLMIWQIKTIGNGTHFRSSIPGFSMFTSPTVAWKIILTFASFHFHDQSTQKNFTCL